MSKTTEQATSAGHRHIIERPRLTRLMDDASARVILLVAPAGYGKTTLARQWLATRSHAWLQANEASSDVVALVLDLERAFATVGFTTNRHLLERVRTMRGSRQELRTLAELQAEGLSPWPDGCWLAIDDYEHIARSEVAEEYLRLLLDSLDMRLLVASRTDPMWATPRARLYGDIYGIDRADLAMRTTEARAVLQAASESRIAQILSLADGWPALIGLASLTDLTSESDHDLPGTLFDYFADELFHRGSRSLQAALPQMAVASHVTQDVVTSLFGPRKGPELLREADNIGFFSATASTVRLHPLLRRFLLTKLPSRTRNAVANKLIHFFLARCDWDEAFELIRAFHDPIPLIELCEAAYPAMLSSGRTTTLTAWLRRAGELGVISPVFDVIRAELALRDGNLSQAKRLALKVINDRQADEYRSRALTLAGRSAHLDNCESDALSYFQAALASARTDDERYEASWGCLLSADAFEDEAELRAVLNQFLGRRPESADDVLRALNASLMVAFATGDISEALESALDAVGALDQAQDPLIRTSFLNTLSRALSLQARYVEGGSFADRLLTDAQDAKLDFVRPHAHVTKAVALIGTRSYTLAEEMLEEAERLAHEIGDRHNVVDARNVRAKLAISQRRHSQALSLLAGLDDAAPVTTTMMAELRATRGVAHASLCHLREADASASDAERLSSSTEIRALIASARAVMRLQRGCDPDQASEELRVAFELTVLDPIVIVCRAFPELLSALSTHYGLGGSKVENLCKKSERPSPPAEAGSLTKREKEVLKLISRGYTNREIADELVIAEVTAKVHVRNVIRKLGVRSRTEAAIAALKSDTP